MIKLLSFILILGVLVVVVELIRKEKLTFKYAFGWILICLLGLFATIFEGVVFELAYLLGFELPSNFIFFSLLASFVFLSLVMTVFLCQQNNRNDSIAQKVAMLELQINELKKNESKDKEKS